MTHPTITPRLNPWWTMTVNQLMKHLTAFPSADDWSVPNGYVTKQGIWLDAETFLPYPSAVHRRLWWKYRFGVSDQDIRHEADRAVLFAYPPDADEDLTRPSRYTVADYHTAPWSFVSLVDFLYCVPLVPGQHWPDAPVLCDPHAASSDLARTIWHPLWHRTERRGEPGWAYPPLPSLFIPDDPRLIPFNQRIDWMDGRSVGQWLAAILPHLESVYGTWPRDPWVLWGFQFLLWHMIGVGYVTWTPAQAVTTYGTAR